MSDLDLQGVSKAPPQQIFLTHIEHHPIGNEDAFVWCRALGRDENINAWVLLDGEEVELLHQREAQGYTRDFLELSEPLPARRNAGALVLGPDFRASLRVLLSAVQYEPSFNLGGILNARPEAYGVRISVLSLPESEAVHSEIAVLAVEVFDSQVALRERNLAVLAASWNVIRISTEVAAVERLVRGYVYWDIAGDSQQQKALMADFELVEKGDITNFMRLLRVYEHRLGLDRDASARPDELMALNAKIDLLQRKVEVLNSELAPRSAEYDAKFLIAHHIHSERIALRPTQWYPHIAPRFKVEVPLRIDLISSASLLGRIGALLSDELMERGIQIFTGEAPAISSDWATNVPPLLHGTLSEDDNE